MKGCREIFALYAYDIELAEPICAEVFPGNSIDASSYSAFILDNDIQRGIIVVDKGFPPSSIRDELAKRSDLHFLTPIKRNDVRISDNDMLSYEGALEGIEGHILYKKKQIKGGCFLYAFKDARRAAAEEAAFLANAEQKKFDPVKYEKKRQIFGVIVLESDQNHKPVTSCLSYDDRWILELVFSRYKSDECLDRTGVQSDFSVIGAEYVNFISTVATCQIIRKAQRTGILKHMSYGELMDDLSSAWRRVDSPDRPASDDGYWIHTLQNVFETLEALRLSEPPPKPEPRKRDRKSKVKDPAKVKPKRPRGRSRKNPTPSTSAL